MKRVAVCLFVIICLLLHGEFVSAQVVVTTSVIQEISKTFVALFRAMQDGDVQGIKYYLSEEEYARRKVLFEQNREYPRFLQNFYRGATVQVGKVYSVRSATDDVVTEFIVVFPSGEKSVTRMRLSRDRSGRWIVKKYLAGKYDNGEGSGESHR
jgi:hypothetical protein